MRKLPLIQAAYHAWSGIGLRARSSPSRRRPCVLARLVADQRDALHAAVAGERVGHDAVLRTAVVPQACSTVESKHPRGSQAPPREDAEIDAALVEGLH